MSEENIPQMRDTIERISKENAGLKTEVSDLQGQVRTGLARDAFREQGYNPANGKLFAAMQPEGEITAEAVVEFATEQGLRLLEGTPSDSDTSGDSASDADDGSEQLAGMSGSGSGAGDGGAGGSATPSLTRQEWQELHSTDPDAAKAAIASGRVEISKDNPFVPQRTPRGINPYAPVAP